MGFVAQGSLQYHTKTWFGFGLNFDQVIPVEIHYLTFSEKEEN